MPHFMEGKTSCEPVAKATALFIQKHGKDRFEAALTKAARSGAVQSGVQYPNQFNQMEEVSEMVKLLEKYL